MVVYFADLSPKFEKRGSLKSHFSLRDRPPGPEIVEFGDLNCHLLPQTCWKRWWAKPPTFFNGFCGKREPFRPKKCTISVPEALLHSLELGT